MKGRGNEPLIERSKGVVHLWHSDTPSHGTSDANVRELGVENLTFIALRDVHHVDIAWVDLFQHSDNPTRRLESKTVIPNLKQEFELTRHKSRQGLRARSPTVAA